MGVRAIAILDIVHCGLQDLMNLSGECAVVGDQRPDGRQSRFERLEIIGSKPSIQKKVLPFRCFPGGRGSKDSPAASARRLLSAFCWRELKFVAASRDH
jgi:hypothetical protein